MIHWVAKSDAKRKSVAIAAPWNVWKCLFLTDTRHHFRTASPYSQGSMQIWPQHSTLSWPLRREAHQLMSRNTPMMPSFALFFFWRLKHQLAHRGWEICNHLALHAVLAHILTQPEGQNTFITRATWGSQKQRLPIVPSSMCMGGVVVNYHCYFTLLGIEYSLPDAVVCNGNSYEEKIRKMRLNMATNPWKNKLRLKPDLGPSNITSWPISLHFALCS